MKKIGIITINDYKNYGNRLQNYASQEVLKSLGYIPETIVNIQKEKIDDHSSITFGDKLKKLTIRKVIGKIYKKLRFNYFYNKKKEKYNKLKEKNFRVFTKKYIKESNYCISEGSYHEKLNEFDCFIVGSDQVWNPNYRSGSSIDFLTFAPFQKRVSYAASFGISSIPEKYAGLYKEWLSGFSSLSVREQAGANIIKQLTGRESYVLVDPTLMLTKQQWLKVSSTPSNKPKGQYILTYFLGDKRKVKEYLKRISNKYNMTVYNMADLSDRESYIQSPSEFIDLIHDSTLIITDSFHGCVFSIIFEKPFVVFERNSGRNNSMNSRIETLLSKFNLESRMIEYLKDEHIFNIDYSKVRTKLNDEKQKALIFLEKALP